LDIVSVLLGLQIDWILMTFSLVVAQDIGSFSLIGAVQAFVEQILATFELFVPCQVAFPVESFVARRTKVFFVRFTATNLFVAPQSPVQRVSFATSVTPILTSSIFQPIPFDPALNLLLFLLTFLVATSTNLLLGRYRKMTFTNVFEKVVISFAFVLAVRAL
jgi:hypothetical protein